MNTSAVGERTRFLPVEGGSANDYDYAMQDPVNVYDLDGRHAHNRFRLCRRNARKCGIGFGSGFLIARRAAARSGLRGAQANAFRHAYWMALTTYSGSLPDKYHGKGP